MKRINLIISGKQKPDLNMAIDYFLWKKVFEDERVAFLRFYQWEPSSISIGYNQTPQNLINIDYCKENKIPVVKRPTGGSAIFHDIELTYSFSANVNFNKEFVSPLSSYISVCKSLI